MGVKVIAGDASTSSASGRAGWQRDLAKSTVLARVRSAGIGILARGACVAAVPTARSVAGSRCELPTDTIGASCLCRVSELPPGTNVARRRRAAGDEVLTRRASRAITLAGGGLVLAARTRCALVSSRCCTVLADRTRDAILVCSCADAVRMLASRTLSATGDTTGTLVREDVGCGGKLPPRAELAPVWRSADVAEFAGAASVGATATTSLAGEGVCCPACWTALARDSSGCVKTVRICGAI